MWLNLVSFYICLTLSKYGFALFLGVADMTAPQVQRSPGGQGNNLKVSLPPQRTGSTTSLTGPHGSPTPPPRPPPHKPMGSLHYGHGAASSTGSLHYGGLMGASSSEIPPALPPKPQRPPMPTPGSILTPTPVNAPTTERVSPTPPPRHNFDLSMDNVTPVKWFNTKSPAPAPPGSETASITDETADNAANECSVCLENPCDSVIYTCGHMCACYDCATDIFKNGDKLCPICRAEIKDIIKIFRS